MAVQEDETVEVFQVFKSSGMTEAHQIAKYILSFLKKETFRYESFYDQAEKQALPRPNLILHTYPANL